MYICIFSSWEFVVQMSDNRSRFLWLGLATTKVENCFKHSLNRFWISLVKGVYGCVRTLNQSVWVGRSAHFQFRKYIFFKMQILKKYLHKNLALEWLLYHKQMSCSFYFDLELIDPDPAISFCPSLHYVLSMSASLLLAFYNVFYFMTVYM